MIISSKVPPKYNNFLLLDYLSSRFTYLTRDQWYQRIIDKKIFCNNNLSIESTKIKSNDIVSYDMPDFIEPPADINYEIVYEDKWLLGINKPGNLLVHHKGKSFKSNLIYQLRYNSNPTYEKAGIVNRLDRETSGIVIVAKDKEALIAMNKIFARREVNKEYLAIIFGVPEKNGGTIDLPIGKVTNSKISYRHGIGGEKAKSALTKYKVVFNKSNNFSLVKLFPHTGRTHQIRVHLSAIGHTILGDKLYSMSDDDFLLWQKKTEKFNKSLPFPRQALHCSKMTFIHPFKNNICILTAKLPEDMSKFLK